ncbi:MAG: hypothetical protein PVH68_10475 [Armatimonadota bacterium]
MASQRSDCPKCGGPIYFTDSQCVACGAHLDAGKLVEPGRPMPEATVPASPAPPPDSTGTTPQAQLSPRARPFWPQRAHSFGTVDHHR